MSMYVTVEGDAEPLGADDTRDAPIPFNATLTLQNDGETRCRHCNAELVEYVYGWVHDGHVIGDPELCASWAWSDLAINPPPPGQPITDAHRRRARQEGCSLATPEPAPRGVNWACAEVGQNDVTVSISVSDPRGAFVMRVWPGFDPDGKPCLYLAVPHPEQSAPHARLDPLPNNPGTYRIHP